MTTKENLLVKYKPKVLDELPLPSSTINVLKKICEFNGGVYIFHSPPGTGKSTACDIILKTAIKRLGKRNILYPIINGSLENTVDVVVNKIQPFAMKAGKRLIIIEEADKLTKETGKGKGAQEALKDLTTRTLNRVTWIFVTNHIEEIIQPLLDRATIIEFKPDKYKMLEILKRINDNENLGYEIHELKAIIETAYPSIRNAILRLAGEEIRQFDSSKAVKDIQKLVNNELDPKTFIDMYKAIGLQPLIRSLLEKGDQYLDKDTLTKIFVLSSYVSELKDQQLAFVTYAYLLNQLDSDEFAPIIDTIISSTIALKTISAKFYQKLQDAQSKKKRKR